MEGRSPKRLRVDDAFMQDTRQTRTPRSASTSQDELAGPGSDDTARSRRSLATRRRRSCSAARDDSDDYQSARADLESPDELDHTYRRDGEDARRRRRSRSHSSTPDQSPADDDALTEDLSTPAAPGTPTPRTSPAPVRKPRPTIKYRPTLILRGHKRGVSAVKISPDKKWIASCSADATIKIWSAETGEHSQTLSGHLAGISTVAWSPDSETLASGSDDKSIRLWDVFSGKAYPVPLLHHSNAVLALAFSPHGNILVSGSADEAVLLWDVRTARILRALPAHADPVGGVDVVLDGTLVVSCATDGLIRVWDTATGQCLRTLVHEDNAGVAGVRFSPNGRFVLAWTLDEALRLWDYVDGRCLKTYQGHRNRKYSLSGAFGVYGAGREAFIVSGSEDGAVVCWDVKSKEVLQRLEGGGPLGHEGAVLGVDAMTRADRTGVLVSCGIDGTVRVWEDDGGVA